LNLYRMLQYDILYQVLYNKLAVWLTPKNLRKTTLLILLKATLYPIILLHDAFTRYRDAKLYQLMITPQVCYLERLLNDRYDYSSRRIRIDDPISHDPWFIYLQEELKPKALYLEQENKPVFLFTEGEAGKAKDDFIIYVPLDIAFDENEMRSLVDNYKLFGKHYKIQRI